MPVLVNNAKYQVDRLNVYPANFVRKYQFVHSDNIYSYTRYARHIDLQKSIKLSWYLWQIVYMDLVRR